MFKFIKTRKRYLITAIIMIAFILLKVNQIIDYSWVWCLMVPVLIHNTTVTIQIED